jgi:hypothetical protein
MIPIEVNSEVLSSISLHSILNSFQLVGPTIWYRVIGEGFRPKKLKYFPGKDTASLREAIKNDNELTPLACVLNLVVVTSDGKETDIDDIQHLQDKDGVFNFEQLISNYNLNENNPIVAKLPGK